MTQIALTDLAIRGLAPERGNRAEIWDSKVPGLGIRVSGHGTRTWVLMYRFGGRKRRLGLGRYPVVSLADARKRAHDILNQVAHGHDPEPATTSTKMGPLNFTIVAERFVVEHCQRHNRASTARETERMLRSRFLPIWSGRLVLDISKAEVRESVAAIARAGTPSEANHALAVISKFFNWCVDEDLIPASPCERLRKPAPVVSRERALSDVELRAVWRACDDLQGPFVPITRLLILTAQRRGEVTGMRWPELDFATNVWTIPGERTKNHRAHMVPLSPAAVAVIQGILRTHDEFVFPAVRSDTTTFSGFSKLKRRLDELSSVADFTLHDLRRSAATGMARLGVSPHVVERVLNHVSGTFAGVAGTYNRFGYLPEMRDALDIWASHINRLTANSATR
ncbi:MAG: tyrosine-type recombinase/integrase [Hyphomicrobium sp.]